MSHFAVLVVLPKDEVEKIEDANKHTGDEEWHNAYNHQWYHSQLEDTLAPYNEQPTGSSYEDDDYFEMRLKICTGNKGWHPSSYK